MIQSTSFYVDDALIPSTGSKVTGLGKELLFRPVWNFYTSFS